MQYWELIQYHCAAIRVCSVPDCNASKSCWQTPKIAFTTVETVFSAKFGPQNCNISHLFCKVWTGCNIVNMFNVIAHSIHDQAYLYGRKIWCTNSRMRVRNMHSPNVAKSHPRVGQSAKSFSAKKFLF